MPWVQIIQVSIIVATEIIKIIEEQKGER